jgi:GR25 family glycosyltransferase involved in LPS biosynthesis
MNEADRERRARSIDEAFPHRVCINLDRRPERWREMRAKFGRHGIHAVRRFAALDGNALDVPPHWVHTPGAYGCLRSHVEVVREARRRGAPSVLIFEDDVVFDPELREKFAARVGELPRDWDMLYFGALHKDEPVRVAEHLARLTRSNSTYAYALRETVFDAFIELNGRAEDVLDNNSFLLQRRFNCYCFMPHLAWVETDYSDAQQRLERHWYLKESLVLFGPQVDGLLADTTLVLAHDGAAGAAENLTFLVAYYDFFFSPHLAVVVVEQGARPSLDPATLPPRCAYVFLRDGGGFDRARCFAAGIAASDPRRQFLILSDGDIYLETLDIRANLRMCERHDGATGFDHVFDLNGEDSRLLRRTKITRGIDLTKSTPAGDARAGCCLFLKREAVGTISKEALEKLRTLRSSGPEGKRLFQSPNHALRLRQG